MAKITLNDLSNITGQETSAIAAINSNNTAIETAIENTLSRDGTSPNGMNADLDMNGNDIINAGLINGIDVTNLVGEQGPPGENGTNGTDGAAATITVGVVTTLAPGASATVTNTGTTSAAVFDFGIPAGEDGVDGAGTVTSIVEGTGIDIDATDPANPIVHFDATEVFTATVTEINYTDGVTSSIQTQLDGKQPLDSDLTAIAGLVDPNADRILFWDDSAGTYAYLTAGTGLTITDTTIEASSSGTSDTDRRNQLLGFANEAKALAGYTRYLDTAAFGFKASGDADGTSTNGAVDTTAGSWEPTISSNGTFLLHCDGTNGSTTFTDSIGGKTVTAVGNAQISTASPKFGTGSASFDGSGDYLTIPDSADFTLPGDFTWSFWMNTSAAGADTINRRILSYNTDAAAAFQLIFESTQGGKISVWNTARIAISTTNVADGNWHHIEVARSGTNLRLFIDGSLEATATNSTTFDCGTNLYIGRYPGSASGHFQGNLDEIYLNNGVADHTASFTAPTAPYSGPTTNNAVLILPYQTTNTARTKARVIVEIDPIDAITIGTDFTIEVTCNGGTNWHAAGSYTNCGKGQSGRTVIETDEITCTSGTSFSARIKNLNNKNVATYKAAVRTNA
jgi:hypothetical protein